MSRACEKLFNHKSPKSYIWSSKCSSVLLGVAIFMDSILVDLEMIQNNQPSAETALFFIVILNFGLKRSWMLV